MNSGWVCLALFAFAGAAPEGGLRWQEKPAVEQAAPQAGDSAQTGSAETASREADELAAIAEYRVLSKPFDARPAANSAQLFNPFEARKPRTFHGSIYEYHRNDNLDARNFFDPVGPPLPEFKRNQFGLQLGGEVGDRLNLFGSYEGLRIVRGSTRISRVPSLAQREGDFSELGLRLRDPLTGRPFPNNRIPRQRLHPVSQRILALFPSPNRSELERNYVNNQPNIDNVDSYLFRADYQLSDRTKLLGRYEYADQGEVDARDLPIFNVIQREVEQEFDLSLNHTFSDRLNSQFSARFLRSADSEISPHAGQAGLLDSLGIAGLSLSDPLDEGYPDLDIEGYANFGDDESPSTGVRNQLVLEGNVEYAAAGHDLQFSGVITFEQLNNFRNGEDRRGVFSFGGSFTGDPLGDFLLGLPGEAERATGSDRVDMRRTSLELSVNDDWRLSPRFNLNLGIRYFYYPPYRSQRPLAGFFPLLVEPEGAGQVVISGTPEAAALGFGSTPGRLVIPDRNDWAPRVALAYSPFGNNRLVLRASYSTFYLPMQEWQAVDFMGRNYPFYQRETAVSSTLTPQLDLSNPFANAAQPEITIRGIEPNIRSPFLQFWNLVLQKRVYQQWKIDLAYHGSKATQLARLVPGNIPRPGPGSIQDRRPIPGFGGFAIVSGGSSWIDHRFNLDVERQFADGFSLRGGLDWGRQISDTVFYRVSNPRDLASERGVEDFRQSSAFINYIVDLPFGGDRAKTPRGILRRSLSGWRLSGTTRVRSGRPFSVLTSSDINNDGLSNDRPQRLGSGQVPGGASIDQWFNVDDFAIPAPFSFGNAGRNILKGPPFQTWDIALSKRTSLADGHFLELRIEFFNAFNHVNFDEPENSLGTSTFGQIFGADEAREIEIAIKYSF